MSTMSLQVKYRPVRIGWCVESSQLEHIRPALYATHAFVGGKFNPLIPIDQPDLADYLTDTFRVDVLIALVENDGIKAFMESRSHLRSPDDHLFYERWQHIPPRAAWVDIYHTARTLAEAPRGPEAAPQPVTLLRWDDADPLRDVWLTTFGAYPPPSDSVPQYARLLERLITTESITLTAAGEPPPDLDIRLTPSRLTANNLEWYDPGGSHDHGFFLGTSDSSMDLLTYWNLRAAGVDVMFLDVQRRDRLMRLIGAHTARLKGLPRRPWQQEDTVPVWSLRDYTPQALQDELRGVLAARPVPYRLSTHTWNGLNVKPVRPQWSQDDALANVDEAGSVLSISFSLPPKPTYDDEPALNTQRLVASISGYDRFRRDHNVMFFPPLMPELNRFYGRQAHTALYGVRSESAHGSDSGIGAFVGISQSSLTLGSIPTLDFVTQLFKQSGITVRTNRAGLVASRLIAQMGGLQGCRVFKIAGVRNLIETYAPDQHFDRTTANKTIGDYDEASNRMRFEPHEQLYLGPRTREKLQPQDALDDLLNRGVFRVGLELVCPHCELPSWVRLDDLSTRVECPLCGSTFDITRQLRDRNWAYRRSGLFGGTSDHQHGAVPVAVTLQQLDTHLSSLSTSGVLYTTCLNLEPADAAINKCETDFVVVQTGPTHRDPNVFELVIGECKSGGGRITARDATNLARVADALPRRRVCTYIVFSKTGTFDEEEVRAAALAQDKWTSRVVLLSKDELEPYEVYERHEEDARRLRSEGLSGLAAFTAHKYPLLKPKADST